MITLSSNQFNREGYWFKPVSKLVYVPTVEDIELFDQNGYDLTQLEKHYAYSNNVKPKLHRDHIHALKWDWFTQGYRVEGSVLNHSLLFERKGYSGAALSELRRWAEDLPLLHKLTGLKPKWGLDFSMDYVNRSGDVIEVVHWEYDSFEYQEVEDLKGQMESRLVDIDWDQAGIQVLKHKAEWYQLDFFEQSLWKCNYFGIPREKFKIVAW